MSVSRTTGVTLAPVEIVFSAPCQAIAAPSRFAPAGTSNVTFWYAHGAPDVAYGNVGSVLALIATSCRVARMVLNRRVPGVTVWVVVPTFRTVTLAVSC